MRINLCHGIREEYLLTLLNNYLIETMSIINDNQTNTMNFINNQLIRNKRVPAEMSLRCQDASQPCFY